MSNLPYVVMRAHNDMPVIAETLERLAAQDLPHRLLVLDNASTDGTLDVVARHGARVIHVPAGTYVPGRVLNRGMAETDGEIVVFLNSDCTPTHTDWLRRLVAALEASEQTAAVFGRQVPRPDCHPLYAKDTEGTYGDGVEQARWRHCFSMAASAIRRSVWQQMPFDEALQYSEDIDWTWRARQRGLAIRYVADAVVMHSHNYTLRQFHKRHYGEARAEARIFEWSPWQRSLLRYAVLPYGRQVLSDIKYCLSRGELMAALSSPIIRLAGILGRWRGFTEGLRGRESAMGGGRCKTTPAGRCPCIRDPMRDCSERQRAEGSRM